MSALVYTLCYIYTILFYCNIVILAHYSTCIGGEKECILISLVRSNQTHTVGFLSDFRRINVAVTRAKRHLCVFADSQTCGEDRFIGRLLSYISTHGVCISAEEYRYLTDYELCYNYTDGDGGSGGGGGGKVADSTGDEERKKEIYIDILTKFKNEKYLQCHQACDAVSFYHYNPVDHTYQLSSPTALSATHSHTDAQDPDAVSVVVMRFPTHLNSHDRMVIHMCCEELGLAHVSAGEGAERYLQVSEHPLVC